MARHCFKMKNLKCASGFFSSSMNFMKHFTKLNQNDYASKWFKMLSVVWQTLTLLNVSHQVNIVVVNRLSLQCVRSTVPLWQNYWGQQPNIIWTVYHIWTQTRKSSFHFLLKRMRGCSVQVFWDTAPLQEVLQAFYKRAYFHS